MAARHCCFHVPDEIHTLELKRIFQHSDPVRIRMVTGSEREVPPPPESLVATLLVPPSTPLELTDSVSASMMMKREEK
ncbi:Hypothetical protein FKW44_024405, partial [Caligus rogercresseyi]